MSEFVWQDQYLLGNEKVDQQHKQLFELANSLVASETREALLEQAMLLFRHVREHFRAEEEFMKFHCYPDYQKHVDTHNLMLDELVTVSDKINQGEWDRQQVLIFMHEWIEHILGEDSAISDYFQAKQD